MGDPGHEKDETKSPPEQAPETGGGIFGGSIFDNIKFAFLAGAAFAAFQWGGEMLDRLEIWIDGEPAAAVTPETLRLIESGVLVDGVIKVADFRMDVRDDWEVERVFDLKESHSFFRSLLVPRVYSGGNDRALILGEPESYYIWLPDNAGQFLLLRQHVVINRIPTVEALTALKDAGGDGLAGFGPTDGVMTPLTIEKGAPLFFSGTVDPATISENDLFDQYFLDQAQTMLVWRNTDGAIDLKHLRRRSIDGYEFGEIDYITGPGDERLTSVFYWHQEDGAQWGEFGLFLARRKEPVAKQHRKTFQSVSSLRLMNGDHQVWQGLNYDAPADEVVGPFVHVRLEATRLQMIALDVLQVEQTLNAQLPVSFAEIEDLVVKTQGDNTIFLRDIANLDRYPFGDDDALLGPDSIILTVSQ
jgi:hypothetical protein